MEEEYEYFSENSDEKSDVEEDDVLNVDIVEDELSTSNYKVPDTERITTPYLTTYEKARVLALRAEQLSKGAPPMIKLYRNSNPIDIANIELERGLIKFIIRRYLPNGMYEEWSVDELLLE